MQKVLEDSDCKENERRSNDLQSMKCLPVKGTLRTAMIWRKTMPDSGGKFLMTANSDRKNMYESRSKIIQNIPHLLKCFLLGSNNRHSCGDF
jgi:hypothetical protein